MNSGVGEQNYFVPALEPLRAFAAFSVLVLHVFYSADWPGFPQTGPLAWFRVGWLGVDIFFVISGFVVTMAAFREITQNNAMPAWRFLARRFARIAPLYYLSLVVWLLAVNGDALKYGNAWFQSATHLLFVHNLFPSTTVAINGPTWTIGTEMQLYLLVAALMPLLLRLRPLWHVIACVGVAISFRYIVFTLQPHAPVAQLSHSVTQMPGMVDSFGLGMALAIWKHRGGLQKLSGVYWMLLCALAISGLAICEHILSTQGDGYWKTWLSPTLFRTFAAFSCAGLVMAALTMPAAIENWIPKAFIFLGQISYGVYLWHAIVIAVLMKCAPMSRPSFLLSTIVITIVLASISWLLIEKPIARAMQKRLSSRQ